MELLNSPWPWYIAGPMISLTMILLLLVGRSLGFSGNFRTMCAIGGAKKISDYFDIDWKAQTWNLLFLVGTILGGYIAHNFMNADAAIDLAAGTVERLESLGFENPGSTFQPSELFGSSVWGNFSAIGILLLGGALIGFGSRYADGCTSGHAISGMANLQLPSLITIIGFFIGGLTMVWFIFPFIFS